MVYRHHDDGWLWRPGPTHVPGDVSGVGVRVARRADSQPACPDHRQQLWLVLLTHAGARQTTQGASTRRRSNQGLRVQVAGR